MREVNLTRQVALRVTAEEAERVERFAARIQIASVAAVMRVAMRLGIDALERNPGLLFDPQPSGEPERCEERVPDGTPCGKPADATHGPSTLRMCDAHFKAAAASGRPALRRVPKKARTP